MTLRLLVLSWFVLLTVAFNCIADQPQRSSEDMIVHYLLAAPIDDIYSRIRSMTPAQKASAIRAVRENSSGAWNEVGLDVLRVLMYLGDPEERAKEIADFRRQRFYNPELVKLGEPWVIEELAPEMFRDEEFTNIVQGDILNYPLSYGVAGLIIANLQNSTIYSDEVLQWAKRTSPHALPQLRGPMREWWRENERFFKEKNYLAVRPGRDVPLEVDNVATAPASPEPVANSPRFAEAPILPASTNPTLGEVVPPRKSTHPSAALLIGAAFVAVAALIGLLRLRRRGGRTPP